MNPLSSAVSSDLSSDLWPSSSLFLSPSPPPTPSRPLDWISLETAGIAHKRFGDGRNWFLIGTRINEWNRRKEKNGRLHLFILTFLFFFECPVRLEIGWVRSCCVWDRIGRDVSEQIWIIPSFLSTFACLFVYFFSPSKFFLSLSLFWIWFGFFFILIYYRNNAFFFCCYCCGWNWLGLIV